jgi:hypothetical protein
MEFVYKICLVVHVISGFSALLFGIISIISKKGLKIHRISGLLFFYAMILVSSSAIIISLMKSNNFLFHIGVFAVFMNYSGYRSIQNKNLLANPMDWIVLLIALINGVFMVLTMNTILVVFGIINSILVFDDLKLFIKAMRKIEIPKKAWLGRHIGMMLGAYISTFTAFLVVNIQNVQPAWIVWLLPTFLGVPLIFYFTKKFVR